MISHPGLPPPTKADRLRALLARCHDDPGLFNAAILGGSPFWWRQEEMSRMVVKHHTTVIAAGNSVGKSYWLGRLLLWWLCTRVNSLVISTAPSHDSLDKVLWKNVRAAAGASRIPLGIRMLRSPLTADMGGEWFALGLATNKTERLSGHHNPNLLAVADEGSGILPEIWEALDSLVPAKLVTIGNPLRADGRFRELFDQGVKEAGDSSIPDAERVASLRVPSTDSPDIHLDKSDRGLAAGAWLRRMYRKYGRQSLWTRTHIDAKFPEANSAGLFLAAWLDACTAPGLLELRRVKPGGSPALGADLGEGTGRDSSVICVRDDLGVREVWEDNTVNLDTTAIQMARLARKWNVPHCRVSYDAMGVGRGLAPKLEGQGIRDALPYKGAASGGNDFTNLRTACAWAARNRLDPDYEAEPGRAWVPFYMPAGDHWPRMREELLELKYELVGKKTRLEPKADLAARLQRSPDRADAFLQTFAPDLLGIAA